MSLLASIGHGARWFVRKALHVYYPRIAVEGRDRIPATGAILFVANHPNSLMDPAVIGFTAQRPVHFFAKAPLFDVPVFGALMKALGMVPAYRGQDDKASVRKNLETLELGAKYLAQGAAVGIFPEGKTHDREGVEQVRTGAARIAASAVQGGAALLIVPLGLNYERKERFRSSIWVRVGEPIDAAKIFREHEGEERKAMRQLTEEIDARLKQAVVHLDEERWQPFLDELEVLLPPAKFDASDSIAALRQRKVRADAINHFFRTDRARAESVGGALEQHRAQAAAAGLSVISPWLQESSVGAFRLSYRLTVKRSPVSESRSSRSTARTVLPSRVPVTGAAKTQNAPSGMAGSIDLPTTCATNIPRRRRCRVSTATHSQSASCSGCGAPKAPAATWRDRRGRQVTNFSLAVGWTRRNGSAGPALSADVASLARSLRYASPAIQEVTTF